MMNRRKFLIICLLAISLIIVLSFLVNARRDVSWPVDLPEKKEFSGFKGKDVAIKIWTHDPLYIKWFKTTIKEFNQLYPDINITADITQINPDSKLMDKTISAMIADKGKPDIVGVNWLYMGKLWRRGLYKGFMPLPLKKEGLLPEFNYNSLATALRPGTNEFYGLPSDVPVTVLWYRRDIMEEEGIEMPLKTWDEFIKVGQKITGDLDGDGEIDRWMTIVMRNHDSSLDGLTPYLNAILSQLGGNIFDKDGNFVFFSEKGAQAAQFVSNLVNKWKVGVPVANYFGGQSGQVFYKGDKAVTAIGPTWYLDYIMKSYYPEQAGKWRAQPLPELKKGEKVNLEGTGSTTSRQGGTYMTIVKSPQQELVWEFLKYSFASSDNLVRYWNQTHYLPPTKEAFNSKDVQEFKSEFAGGQKLGKLYSKQIKSLEPLYTNKRLDKTLEAMVRYLPDLIDGKISGRKYVEKVRAAVE